MDKRQAVDEMMRQVKAGHAFTIEANGEPAAIVVPWECWAGFKAEFAELNERGEPSVWHHSTEQAASDG